MMRARPPPATHWDHLGERAHLVQFYEDSPSLLDALGSFVASALKGGHAAIVVAKQDHLQALAHVLHKEDIDVAAARHSGQYMPFDAAEVLPQILTNGWPDAKLFESKVATLVSSARQKFGSVRVFGEMVSLLWEKGRYGAAIRLEELWSELAQHEPFSLFCAYALGEWQGGSSKADRDLICTAHSHLVLDEVRHVSLVDPGTRSHTVEDIERRARHWERELVGRRFLERKLAQREQELGEFLDQAVIGLHNVDRNGIILWANKAELDLLGYRHDEYVGRNLSDFHIDTKRASALLNRLICGDAVQAERAQLRCKDGERFWASVVIDAVYDEQGKVIGFAKITRDLTKRRAIEEQLRHAQKMEAIGQLTGGVAHDFNNLLTVIVGSLETIWRLAPADDGKLRRAIDQTTRGAQRAVTLTQQLLAFSRPQPLNPKPTDINRLVGGMSDLVRRTIGESIAVETVLAGGLWRVEVDAHQLESALLNLAVNARDAMSGGGKLTIETANSYFDEAYAAHYPELKPGEYVVVCVTDSGSGMSPEMLARAFEPFFTTKPIGQGTGLGLSQVYGFVKQSGGHVKLYSELGEGTTVKLYLPRLSAPVPDEQEARAPILMNGGRHEVILVVEDDDDVRMFIAEKLQEMGFSVIETATAAEGLSAARSHSRLDAVIVDRGLPDRDGLEVVSELRVQLPSLPVIVASGYGDGTERTELRQNPFIRFLAKPFDTSTLVAVLASLNVKQSQE